jgi:carboxyl-terminal processing protease
MMPRYHVLRQRFDDRISQQAWTNLVTFYDFDHSVFLQSDLDELSVHRLTLDDEFRNADASFAFKVHNLYCRRLAERIEFATNLLAGADWDFSSNEMFRVKRKDAPWPRTRLEAENHWRLKLKNEILVQILNAELDKSTNKVDAAGNLVKKYHQYHTVLNEPDEETVLQRYLSAVA